MDTKTKYVPCYYYGWMVGWMNELQSESVAQNLKCRLWCRQLRNGYLALKYNLAFSCANCHIFRWIYRLFTWSYFGIKLERKGREKVHYVDQAVWRHSILITHFTRAGNVIIYHGSDRISV